MRTYISLTIVIVLLQIPLLAFAGAQEEGAEATPEQAAAVAGEGGIIYPTLANYEELTGKTIATYNEAPMLQELVAAGELPPVEQRLPEEVLVVEPFSDIGKYGGTLRLGDMTTVAVDAGGLRRRGLFWSYMNGSESVPNMATGYEWSDDVKTITIFLRPGHKWSDGEPFTTEDVRFFFEDVLMNTDLTPIIPPRWSPEGKPVKFINVNAHTFRLQYQVPYPRIFDVFQRGTFGGQNFVHAPMHALAKYHLGHNSKAAELAKEEGFENWIQLYRNHARKGWSWDEDPEIPVLAEWAAVSVSTELKVMQRNPYFHWVDVAGNQLPYIDRIEDVLTRDNEVHNLRIMSGDIDLAGFSTHPEDFPLLKANEAEGNYRVELARTLRGSEAALFPNLTAKDPVLRETFQDVRFRRALSLAINRDEINELVYFGKAVPRQAALLPEVSYYKEEWGTAYAQYDPDEARRLLDEMGLNKDADGNLLRSDGGKLSAVINVAVTEGSQVKVAELVSQDWAEIGFTTVVKPTSNPVLHQLVESNESDITVFHLDRTGESFGARGNPYWSYPGDSQFWTAWPWTVWFKTHGEAGEEPPESWKAWMKDWDAWFQTETGSPEYMELAHKVYDFVSSELFVIGTVGMSPWVIVYNEDLRNTPPFATWSSDVDFWGAYMPAQFYFDR